MTLSAPAPVPAPAADPAAADGAPTGLPGATRTRPTTRQVLATALRRGVRGTPGRLRVLGALALLAALAFGGCAIAGATARNSALGDARSAAAQLVRIESIRTNLVSADANLTNAFLVGGLEPPAAQRGYQNGIGAATRMLGQAAAVDGADAARLAPINTAISRYTGLIAAAQSYNRQGFPIGEAYLTQASALLRSAALMPLEKLSTAVQRRVDSAYRDSAHAAYWLIAGLLIVVVVLVGVQVWLALRTRRLLNFPVLTATALVVITGAVLGGTMLWSSSKADDARRGSYFTSLELATARVDAFDAKSDESLTLINRGSGQPYEAQFQEMRANIVPLLDDVARHGGPEATARRAFTRYLALHKTIRARDDGGNWQSAVDLATGTAGTDANAVFAAFDRASAQALAQRAHGFGAALSSARDPLVPLGLVALIGGILAAAATWWGISNRLREYR